MAEISPTGPQYVGKADFRLKQVAEAPITKEAGMSAEQKQFYDRYQTELKRAKDDEQAANQHARDRLKGLSAPELRRAGLKQVLWGWGLSVMDGIGAGLATMSTYALGAGALALGAGALAISTPAIATALTVAGGVALAASIPMALVGSIGGAELAGIVYNKFIRPRDKDLRALPQLDKTDWVLGGILFTPPFIAGLRNIFEGFNRMDSQQ